MACRKDGGIQLFDSKRDVSNTVISQTLLCQLQHITSTAPGKLKVRLVKNLKPNIHVSVLHLSRSLNMGASVIIESKNHSIIPMDLGGWVEISYYGLGGWVGGWLVETNFVVSTE